ncbi:MAG: SDR family NAD(P)-dependent oxidoreductase [Halothermotrichaceae bacterium]
MLVILNLKLKDKVALVTGGKSGIGKAAATILSDECCIVYVNDIVDPRECVKQINENGGNAVGVKADVSDFDAVKNMVDNIVEEHGRIDILVNNAGIRHPVPFEELTPAEWAKVINIDLDGVYNCCKAVFSHMRKQQFGRIVNISSINAYRGGGLLSTSGYSAAKAGVLGLTKGLAREGAESNITVNSICPGWIDTPMTNTGISQERIDAVIDSVPLGRAGKPEDIANAITFMVSDMGSYITGEVLHVNGGLYMTL